MPIVCRDIPGQFFRTSRPLHGEADRWQRQRRGTSKLIMDRLSHYCVTPITFGLDSPTREPDGMMSHPRHSCRKGKGSHHSMAFKLHEVIWPSHLISLSVRGIKTIAIISSNLVKLPSLIFKLRYIRASYRKSNCNPMSPSSNLQEMSSTLDVDEAWANSLYLLYPWITFEVGP